MKSKIQFIADTKEILEVLPRPYPAIDILPDWYSNMPSYYGGEGRNVDEHGDPKTTIKKCMPIFDSMTAGYHIPLHSDVWIDNKGENDIKIKWSWDTMDVVSMHNRIQYETYPVPEGYYPIGFKWINPWIVKTPPGWSSLFIHPNHHDDLPFKCLTGIVDTDKFPNKVNFIFFLKKDFSGLIPMETPLIQVIPFKRSDFKSEFSYDKGFFKKEWQKAHRVFFDRYKRFFRSPKKYEQGDVKKCPFAFLHK